MLHDISYTVSWVAGGLRDLELRIDGVRWFPEVGSKEAEEAAAWLVQVVKDYERKGLRSA